MKTSDYDCQPASLLPIARLDPRDPRPNDACRHPIFRYHNCARCANGARPCVKGNPNDCDNPYARND
jgi:hypothetical protein